MSKKTKKSKEPTGQLANAGSTEQAENASAPSPKHILKIWDGGRPTEDFKPVRGKGKKAKGTTAAPSIYQFLITLQETEPPIWRRIQVEDCALADLHIHIQNAMGWDGAHLYEFEIYGKRCGDPEILDGGIDGEDLMDAYTTTISDLGLKGGRRMKFMYEYDFGDNWRHQIMLEKFLPAEPGQKYPRCLAGERACPPEDIGGPWGFHAFLEAINNPNDEDHEHHMEWHGPFDADAFDPAKATKAMRQGF